MAMAMAAAVVAPSKYVSESTEKVYDGFTGIDEDEVEVEDEDEDYFSRFAVADDHNHDDCIGNDKRVSSAPIRFELIKGVWYASSYQLRRGDPSSGDVHYHKIVVNAARDAFYVDGVKKSMDVPEDKAFMESLWRRDLPDEFQGEGVHKIREIYLQNDKMWEAPEEERVVVVEAMGPDEMM